MAERYPLWIAGAWEEGEEPLHVTSPYDGAPVGDTSLAGPGQIEKAIAAAVHARKEMADLSSRQRAEVLMAVGRRMAERKDDAVRLMVLEAGKPLRQAAAEFERALLTIQTAAEESKRAGGDVLDLDLTATTRGHMGIVRRFPIGPVLGISPFNFPLNLAMHKVASAIASGNPIVLKPAAKTPLTWLAMARLFAETDLPKGALSVLVCTNERTGRMVEDERFAMVSFTGSAPVGWSIKARAGKKKVVLELGGNAGAIVDASADVDAAAQKLVVSAFAYAGQSCISAQRLFVLKERQEDFTERFVQAAGRLKVGDPQDPDTDVGPLIDGAAARRGRAWVGEARAQGARQLVGGDGTGNVVPPTVLAAVPSHARVCAEEVFGPVAVLAPADSFQEALVRVNDSRYGLQAAVFTRDLPNAFRAFRELEVGGVIVNEAPSYRVDPMPYGGVKESGFGREGLRYAMEEMTEPRIMVVGGMG